jgi:hypothetical protein
VGVEEMKNLDESLLEPLDEAAGIDVMSQGQRRKIFRQIIKLLNSGTDMLKLWRLQDRFSDEGISDDMRSIEQSLYSSITSLEGLGDVEDWT